MFKAMVFISLTVLAGSLGHVLLSRGMRIMGPLESYQFLTLWNYFFVVLQNPWIIAGVLVEILYFLLWILVLSLAEVSFAVPMSALEYFFVTFMAIFFLNEEVNWNRWVGLVLICVGVFFMMRSWNEGIGHRG